MRHTNHRLSFWHHKTLSIVLLSLLLTGLYFLFQKKSLTPSASTEKRASSQVSVAFCTEGEGTDTCDPSQNLYSEHAISNVLSFTVTQNDPPLQAICLQAETESLLVTPLHGTAIISDTKGTTLATYQDLTSDKDGKITIALEETPALTLPITLRFKADGYFARSITVENYDANTCINYAQANKLIRGDFNNDGALTFDDVTLIIKAYRGTSLQFVPAVFGEEKPEFSHVLEIIKKYRQQKDFHDA
ncbi:MAG TPA: hypothetical protein VGE59_04140 [Patescibacteria group bacterium]